MTLSESKPEQLPTASVLKPIILSILILASGVAIGVGLTLIITADSDTTSRPPENPTGITAQPLPEDVIESWLEHFEIVYKLTPEQKELLKPILRKWATDIEFLRINFEISRNRYFEEIAGETDKMHKAFVEILNESQKEVLNRQFANEWNRLFDPWHIYRNPEFQPNRGDRPRGGRNPNPQQPGQRPIPGTEPNSQPRRERRFPGGSPQGQFPPEGMPPINGMRPPADDVN